MTSRGKFSDKIRQASLGTKISKYISMLKFGIPCSKLELLVITCLHMIVSFGFGHLSLHLECITSYRMIPASLNRPQDIVDDLYIVPCELFTLDDPFNLTYRKCDGFFHVNLVHLCIRQIWHYQCFKLYREASSGIQHRSSPLRGKLIYLQQNTSSCPI